MSTADVARAAADLSNIRNRLMFAANDAQSGMFTNNRGRAVALKRLIAAVDQSTDLLLPFAFYDQADTERAVGLSAAVGYARNGDALSAGQVLVELFASSHLGEVA